jgi:histidinol dehydrogenase
VSESLCTLELCFTGAATALSPCDRIELFDRTTSRDASVRAQTAAIIARVRADGDAALYALARELDSVALEQLEIPRAWWQSALDTLEPALRRAMTRAATNIARMHAAAKPQALELETEPGIVIGRRPDPLGRVGVYAPGGRATYPSSVLMGAVPARVAGVGEVIVCSPPGRDGLPSPVVLAAAELANVDRVFALGGAGAVAAMAYGTESVPRVDRIVGPGNAYVAEAKLQVSGSVAIDSPAGPSELLVIADATAEPRIIAREMLAQAEHDPRACVVAVTVGATMAARVVEALRDALPAQSRRAIIAQALGTRGGVLSVATLHEAIAFANDYAPEHLLLAIADPASALEYVRHAGTVFLGETSSVAFGDYLTGANHVLPTGGLARSYSGLSTLDFVRWTTYQRVAPDAAERLAEDVSRLAEAEGLPAHAAAARGAGRAPAPTSSDAGALARVEFRPPSSAFIGGASCDASAASSASAALHGRPSYRDIALYAPDRSAARIDLSDNTNLWGAPPTAARVIRDAATPALTRYPALYAADLQSALAEYTGARREEIATGCGSDDVLDSAIRAFAEPGDRVAYPDPSFAMLPLFAKMNGLAGVAVPLTSHFDIDADAMLDTGARIIYLCSPNNPTGTAAARATIERVIARAPGLVILDEAYAEFADDGFLADALRSDRLLVVRTMSKAFGLAGLRVGYAVGHAELVAEVEKSRGPYKVNALAERAAVTALREDRPWVQARVADVRENRARLRDALTALGLAPLPSAANFVLVPVPDAGPAAQRLRAAGVAVRPFVALPGIGDALRITIGPWSLMNEVLAALAGVSPCV